MPATKTKPSVHTKLNSAMIRVERIGKDARNNHQNYNYASEKAIKEAIHPVLAELGVLFRMEITGLPQVVGNSLFVPMRYHFTCVDTGEMVSGDWMGSGQTRDEKGMYAAVTGAIKYALTTALLIPTGDDPEKDDAPGKPVGGHASPSPAGKPGQDVMCSKCGFVRPLDGLSTIPSKFEPKYPNDPPKGHPIYKCGECGKWTPVSEAPKLTKPEQEKVQKVAAIVDADEPPPIEDDELPF